MHITKTKAGLTISMLAGVTLLFAPFQGALGDSQQDGTLLPVSAVLTKDLVAGKGYQLQPEVRIVKARAVFTMEAGPGRRKSRVP